MKKPTQKERVVGKLLKSGFITRNECLRNYISRLGALICDLEAEGWQFEAKYQDDKDYRYTVISCPLRMNVYKVGDKTITTWKKEH